MVYAQGIKGKTMYLRPVEVSDAEFLVQIRTDKKLAKYMHGQCPQLFVGDWSDQFAADRVRACHSASLAGYSRHGMGP